MSLIQILLSLYFSVLGAVLSVLMAKLLHQNGTVLKRMEEGFRLVGGKMDEGFRLIARLIVEEDLRKRKEILKDLEGGS